MKINDTLIGYAPGARRQPASSGVFGAAFDRPDSSKSVSSGGDAYDALPTRKLALALSGMNSEGDGASHADKARTSGKTAEENFLKWSKMSVPERIRAQILESHHLSEDDLKSLSKEDRDAIEREIQEAIKRNYGSDDDNGPAASVSAT